jgi:hypothetical protein
MSEQDDFFIGWSAQTPRRDRRFMLGAGLALIAGAGGMGAALALDPTPIGNGFWDQGEVRTLRGLLTASPYPTILTHDLDGTIRTVFLATSGKTAPRIDAALVGGGVSLTGTLIIRGRNAMIAVNEMSAISIERDDLAATAFADRGPVTLVGEILDAKCWFGAMRPGYGRTHKACAALCARGGLPLAFCQLGACSSDAAAPLLLDENGRAFGHEVLPLVADPVAINGRMVEAGDVLQIRAALSDIRRI